MTAQYVQECVDKIEAISWDLDAATAAQNRLYSEICRRIFDGTILDQEECCRIALKTEKILRPH